MKRPLVMVVTSLILWSIAGSAFATGQQMERPTNPGHVVREHYNVDHARTTEARHERADRATVTPLREYRTATVPVQGAH